MNVKVILFGSLADLAGCSMMDIDNIPDVSSLKLEMERKIQGLRNANYSIAVNGELVRGNVTFENGYEIAFLPPFAGG